MLAIHRALIRWVNKTPDPEIIRYCWWVVGEGFQETLRLLVGHGFNPLDIPSYWYPERDAEFILEVWDTERFLDWRMDGRLPDISKPFTLERAGALADHVDDDVVAPCETHGADYPRTSFEEDDPHVTI